MQIGKRRWGQQSDYFEKLKQSTLFSEFIQDISIHGSNNWEDVIIELVSNNRYDLQSIRNNHNILISYNLKDNKIDFFNSLYFNKKNRGIINTVFLKSDELINTILWAIKNNFNIERSLRTAKDDDFYIDFHNGFLSISLPRTFNSCGKNFTIWYQYDQRYTEKDFIISTSDGFFKIDTNVEGLQDYITTHRYDSSSLPKGGSIYFVNDFVRNLVVDENDLPEHLKRESSKIKTLRK